MMKMTIAEDKDAVRVQSAAERPDGVAGDARAAEAVLELNLAGLSEKAGMISRAKRRRLSREPPQFMITYSTPTRRKASSLLMIFSGAPTRLFAFASSGA